MARRYQPREHQLSPLSVLAVGLDSFQEGRREKREREEADQQGSLADALQRMELDELGVREGTAPTRPVAVEDSIFAGERPGMGRGTTGPSGLGMSLDAARQMGPKAFAPRPDPNEIMHHAGSFVRGVGFTEKHLTRGDLDRLRPGGVGGETMQVGDDRYSQLNDDYYVDREATPEARGRRSAAARTMGLLEAFRGMGARPDQLALLEADEGFADEIYDQLNEEEESPEIEGTLNRRFPDTDAGRIAALEWERMVRDARADPDGPGGVESPTREVTRRSVALAAARAVAAIQTAFRTMSQTERDRRRDGGDGLQRDIEGALRPFGYTSLNELNEDMRALRIGNDELAPASSGQGGAGAEFDETEIDRLLEENPDLSDEEIAELLLGDGS